MKTDRKLGWAFFGILVVTIAGLFCSAPPPEAGGEEGHRGFVAPVGSEGD